MVACRHDCCGLSAVSLSGNLGVLDGESSREEPVDSDVPQGTVLGHLLFLCHINDLPASVKFQVRLFSGDCLLYRIEAFSDHIALQNDVKQLEKWAKERVNSNPYLVLTISDDLKWHSHISTVAKKQTPHPVFLGVTYTPLLNQ